MKGISINPFNLNGTQYPLIWGGDTVNYTYGASPDSARLCYSDALNNDLVAGKIVFCEKESDGSSIFEAKGIGCIMAQTEIVNPDFAFSHPLPVTRITPGDARKVMEYISSTKYAILSNTSTLHLVRWLLVFSHETYKFLYYLYFHCYSLPETPWRLFSLVRHGKMPWLLRCLYFLQEDQTPSAQIFSRSLFLCICPV